MLQLVLDRLCDALEGVDAEPWEVADLLHDLAQKIGASEDISRGLGLLAADYGLQHTPRDQMDTALMRGIMAQLAETEA